MAPNPKDKKASKPTAAVQHMLSATLSHVPHPHRSTSKQASLTQSSCESDRLSGEGSGSVAVLPLASSAPFTSGDALRAAKSLRSDCQDDVSSPLMLSSSDLDETASESLSLSLCGGEEETKGPSLEPSADAQVCTYIYA